MNNSIWPTSERFPSDLLTKNETTPMTLHDFTTSLKPLVLFWEDASGRNYTLCIWVPFSMGGFGEFCVCDTPKGAEWRKNEGSQQHWQVDSTRLQLLQVLHLRLCCSFGASPLKQSIRLSFQSECLHCLWVVRSHFFKLHQILEEGCLPGGEYHPLNQQWHH